MLALLIPYVLKLGIPERFAKPVLIAMLVVLAVLAFGLTKCAYDKSVITRHDAKLEAATAKADLKANDHAAEQRRADDSRLQTETQEVKDAVQKAGSDPAARRAAYYECVRRQQLARASGKLAANC